MNSDERLSLEEAAKQAKQFGFDPSHNGTIDEHYIAPPNSDTPQALYESVSLMISDFNRFFIQVLIGKNIPSVIWEREDDYVIFSYENFHKQFSYVQVANDLFSEKNKAVSSVKATKLWLDSNRKRSSPGIKFWPSTTAIDPEDRENKLFNTWREWPTRPAGDRAKWKIIFRYIYVVLCDRKRAKAHHLLDFYAHLFQRPEQKPSFGIALRGEEEGTGKSMFITEVRKIVGRDYSFATADPEDIFGKNNPGMDCCLLLHLEEVEWAKYNRYANKLRNLFTTLVININDKYEKQVVQNSFTRIAISGNAEHIMHVSRTGRRLAIFDVAPVKISDTDYFGDVKATFETGGREALLWKLLHRDISRFNPFKPLHTTETDEQKELSMGDVAQFWQDEILEECQLPYDEIVRTSDGKIVCYKVVVEKLVWCFNEWQKRRGERPISSKSFGKRFRKLVPEMPPARNVKVTPAGMKKQFNCFEIKGLQQCREHFVEHQGLKHKIWDEAEEFELLSVDTHQWYKGF